ncbi:hypothetical protein ACXZ9C_10735 [Streptococcus agalactiae]
MTHHIIVVVSLVLSIVAWRGVVASRRVASRARRRRVASRGGWSWRGALVAWR